MSFNGENMMTSGFRLNMAGLNALDMGAKDLVLEATKNAIEDIRQHIIDSWSEESPSAPGEPPAKVSGYLEKSLQVVRRDSAGRFATLNDAVSWTLTVEAEYGAALEYGRPEINLQPRPFLRPAMEEARQGYEKYFTDLFKFAIARRVTGFKEYWEQFGTLPRDFDLQGSID